jgi:hypothetical protein
MARGPRLSLEQIEEMMIPKLVEAIYPVLIPIEQQDCAIQAANHARMTEIARLVWRAWATAEPKRC